MSKKLEEIVKGAKEGAKEGSKEPGKVRKILKRLGLTAASLVLAGAIAGSYVFLKKEGEPIKGNLNGRKRQQYSIRSR